MRERKTELDSKRTESAHTQHSPGFAFGVNWLCASAVFAFKLILPPGASAANSWQAKTATISFSNYWRVLLPGIFLSMLVFPLLYVLIKAIGRIGVRHDV